jgi:hypothetical protein
MFVSRRSFSSSLFRLFPRKKILPPNTNQGSEDAEPENTAWKSSRLSKSKKSGWDPALAFDPSSVSSITETVRSAVKEHKTPSNPLTPSKTIPVFKSDDPATQVIFLRKLRSKHPTERIAIIEKNLSSLSGYEKIDLFRVLALKNFVPESYLVYKTLYSAQIMARLKYVDHHRLFFQLSYRAEQYHSEMLFVWRCMRGFELKPTATFYGILLQSAASVWKDATLCDNIYKEMCEMDYIPEKESLNAYLGLLLYSKDEESLQKAKRIWEKVQNDLMPDLTTVKRAFELYGRLEDRKGVDQTMAMAEKFKETIEGEYNEKIKDKKDATPFSISLLNAYTSALIDCGANDAALAILIPAMSSQPKAGWKIDTINIAMKAAVSKEDAKTAESLFALSEDLGVRPDLILYGRLLVAYGIKKDVPKIKSFYESAIDKLRVEPGSKRALQLQTSLLQALVKAGEYQQVADLYQEEISKYPRPLRITIKIVHDALEQIGDTEGAAYLADKHQLVNMNL